MSAQSAQTKTIARSAGTVSVAVFASRILGLVREQVFAALFGAGFAYDSFVVAYRIPNLLRDLFAEGALSSAFVAVFTDYKTTKGHEETWRLANKVITAIVLIVGAITLAGAFFSSEIVALITRRDFTAVPAKAELTSLMTTIMFPFLILVSLSAVAMGILNTMGKFFIPALASSFFNLGSVVSGVLLAFIFPAIGLDPIVGMACGVVIGGVLQLIIQVPLLKKQGFSYGLSIDFRDPGLRRILMLMIPAVIGLSATQINMFINTFFASGCAQGSLSWLQYAFRVMMFPIGLVGVSLSIATMPVVSRHAATGDIEGLRGAFVSSTVFSLVLSLPATFGLVFLSRPIIRVIFEHGQFTPADTGRAATALMLYAIGLAAYSGLKIIVPVFYALNKTKYPVIGSFIAVIVNVAIILSTIPLLRYKAIALSTALCITVNFVFLSVILYRTVQGYDIQSLIRCLIKIVPASLVTGALALWVNTACKAALDGMLFDNLISLLAGIAAGIVFYAAVVSFLGIREVDEIRQKLVSQLFPR